MISVRSLNPAFATTCRLRMDGVASERFVLE
jgi:hypothetical protein